MMRFSLCILLMLVLTFSAGAQDEKPDERGGIDFVIAADSSGTFRLVIDRQLALIREIVGSARPGDCGGLITYASAASIRERQFLTEDVSEIVAEAENIYAEPGAKALLDGIRFGARTLAKSDREGRRVLIVITDGEDRESASSVADVAGILREGRIELYVIAMSDGVPSMRVVDRLVKEVNGTRYVPKRRADDAETVRQLWSDIRSSTEN